MIITTTLVQYPMPKWVSSRDARPEMAVPPAQMTVAIKERS